MSIRNIELCKQLQSLMHKHGLELFVQELVQAAYYASDDVECISENIAQQYRDLANFVLDFEIREENNASS